MCCTDSGVPRLAALPPPFGSGSIISFFSVQFLLGYSIKYSSVRCLSSVVVLLIYPYLYLLLLSFSILHQFICCMACLFLPQETVVRRVQRYLIILKK